MPTDQFRAFADALSARYSLMLTQGPVFTVDADALRKQLAELDS